jgi:signal peptidase II
MLATGDWIWMQDFSLVCSIKNPASVSIGESMPDSKNKRHIRFVILVAAVVAMDQLVKALIIKAVPAYQTVSVIPGFFNLTHIYNTGGAFGFLSGNTSSYQQLFFLTASIVAVFLILYLYSQTPPNYKFLGIGFSLILGGALGNLADRIRIGKVVDFLDFHIMDLHWPSFNIADSAITIGIFIFLYHLLFKKIPI